MYAISLFAHTIPLVTPGAAVFLVLRGGACPTLGALHHVAGSVCLGGVYGVGDTEQF